MKLKFLSSLAVIQLFLVSSGTSLTANAATLVSNIAEPTSATTAIPTAAGWAAQSFATDANSYTLTSVGIVAGNYNGLGDIVAELRAGTINSIGATLGSFTVPAVTVGSPAALTLTTSPSTTFSLAPSTYYWLVLGTTGGAEFGWDYAIGNNQTGPGSLGNYAYSPDNGLSWGQFNSDNPYRIEVNAAPVPLPAAIWLFGSGLVSLLSLPRIRGAYLHRNNA